MSDPLDSVGRMLIDLHTHSTVSDGTDTPEDLMGAAWQAGLAVVALADHDTTAGWAQAQAAARRCGVRFVPAVEVSTSWQRADVHLLALWPDGDDERLQQMLTGLRTSRDDRVPRILARLHEHGIEISAADVQQAAGDAVSVGRPHVADALVAVGVVSSRAEAFEVWLADGRPAHVSKAAPDLLVAIDVVRAAGGVPVLAHPWGRGSVAALTESALAVLATCGLVGLEVDHVDHDAPTRERLRGLADDLGLVVTGASDYHGHGKAGVGLGENVTAPGAFEQLQQVRDELARARGGPDP